MISTTRSPWGKALLSSASTSSSLRAVQGKSRISHHTAPITGCVICMSSNKSKSSISSEQQSPQRSREPAAAQVDASSGGPEGGGTRPVLPSVTRSQVLSACVTTSLGMLAVSFLLRELARVGSAPMLGTSQETVDELLRRPALATAGTITLMRLALLKTWPDFADSTERSNTQVLTPLELVDIPIVASLPGIAEEALFRGTLVPATFPDWRGVVIAGIVFGVLHNNGGRNWAFSAWASAVGVFYGALFLYTKDISAPIIAHSVANMASALIWIVSRDENGAFPIPAEEDDETKQQ